jgi:type II secretory pathway component PulM
MSLLPLSDWYARLAAREQRVVGYGAVAAGVLALLGLLLPLHGKLVATQKRVASKQADLVWMQAVAPAIAAAGPLPVTAAGPQESLVVMVDRTARESGLAQSLTGSQPSGDGGLRVQLEKAPFNSLVTWLARMAEQNGVQVDSATVDGAGEPGIVNAAVVLRGR